MVRLGGLDYVNYGNEKKNIIIEKIQKCSIILSKEDYNKEISKIKFDNYNQSEKPELEYIDYKQSFIDTLDYLLKEGANINEAIEKLKIRKKFNFNHEAQIGENNYFFYRLALELELKIEEICLYFNNYEYIIQKAYIFMVNTHFSNLSQKEKHLFNYISFILLAKGTIKNASQSKKVQNYLEGECVDINELEKAIL